MKPPATPSTYLFIFRDQTTVDPRTPEEQQQAFQRWLDWVADMRAKGQYVAGNPLEPGPASVLRGKSSVMVTDGPFAEGKEILGGYMLIRAGNQAEAVEIARGCPGLPDGSSVEVRKVLVIPD